MQEPFVSIIVPNYCHANYLEQRLSSILSQTYINYELIILDDASPDNGESRRIIESHRGHPRINHILYNEKNSGSTFLQWKKGISLAMGDWIWIAESDDFCKETLLQSLVNLLDENIAFVYCASKLVDEDGSSIGLAPTIPEKIIDGRKFIKSYMITGSSVWNASAVVFNKSMAIPIIDNILDFKAAGDYMFWCMMAEKGEVGFINKPLNSFRQHSNKVTRRSSTNGTEDLEVLSIIKFLQQQGYLDGFSKVKCLCHYFHRLFGWKYDSEDLRKKLIENYLQFTSLPLFFFKTETLIYRTVRFLKKICK